MTQDAKKINFGHVIQYAEQMSSTQPMSPTLSSAATEAFDQTIREVNALLDTGKLNPRELLKLKSGINGVIKSFSLPEHTAQNVSYTTRKGNFENLLSRIEATSAHRATPVLLSSPLLSSPKPRPQSGSIRSCARWLFCCGKKSTDTTEIDIRDVENTSNRISINDTP